jgi:RNA polymerase sigma-70 factor, ECF subfamily
MQKKIIDTQMRTDEELILDFRNGSAIAFNTLVERYTSRLHQFLGGTSDAMDLVQETFNKAYRNLNSFNIERPFKPWLFKIAKNCSIDANRKAGVRFPLLYNTDVIDVEDINDCPAISVTKVENRTLVKAAIEKLPAQQKQVLILSYYQNMSYPQIAKSLNISTSTVKTHMARAIQKLITLLPDVGNLS